MPTSRLTSILEDPLLSHKHHHHPPSILLSSLIFSIVLTMADVPEVQVRITGNSMQGAPELLHPSRDATPINKPPPMFKHWKWWVLVSLNISFLLVGQTVATLLGRFYFNQGGNSKWMATLVQSVGSPLLLLPLLLLSTTTTTTTTPPRPPLLKITAIYTTLGLMIAGDNLMYSYGLLYLPVSTYSLVCATQLAFNVVFSYFLNSLNFTHLIFNSVVLLTFSAALLGVRSDASTDGPKGNYPLGFVLTLAASATLSLILSLMQLTFQRVLKRTTFSVVLELQAYTNLVAAAVSAVGLFASGEWRGLEGEMRGFGEGRVSYVMTLVWTAVSWQLASVGGVGLTFVVSSLFANVISTLALPVVPVFAVVFFHDKMDGVKVVSMLIALWGFLSYIYQHYLDDLSVKEGMKSDDKELPVATAAS